MSVYVDDMMMEWRGRRWCHMMADTDDELHTFASKLCLRRAWFQGDHYDVTDTVRARALILGAQPVTPRFMVELRRTHRKGGH